MKTGNRSNALLVELLIVVLFFMLSSTVLLQVFSFSRSQSVRAGMITQALIEAQNVSDRLYAAEDREAAHAALRQMGFEEQGDASWQLRREDYALRVLTGEENREAGVMRLHTVEACREEEILVSLPVCRYEEGKM